MWILNQKQSDKLFVSRKTIAKKYSIIQTSQATDLHVYWPHLSAPGTFLAELNGVFLVIP